MTHGTPGTTYAFCGHCKHRRELVPTGAGVSACHACGEVADLYPNREEYEEAQEALDALMEDGDDQ